MFTSSFIRFVTGLRDDIRTCMVSLHAHTLWIANALALFQEEEPNNTTMKCFGQDFTKGNCKSHLIEQHMSQ